MTAKFVYDKRCEAILSRTMEMARALKVPADLAAAASRGIAPVVEGQGHVFKGGTVEPPGAYRDSIKAVYGIDSRGAIGRVNAYNFKAVWIEYGTGQPFPTPPFRVLQRGAEMAGLHFVPGRSITRKTAIR